MHMKESLEIPGKMQRKIIYQINPISCAEELKNICDVFFEDVVIFERKSGFPKKRMVCLGDKVLHVQLKLKKM